MRASLREITDWTRSAITDATWGSTGDGTDATGYRHYDRLDQRQHLGVTVLRARSRNTEQNDGATDIWIEETLTVRLDVQIGRTPGQLEIDMLAADHEERIRELVVSDAALRPHRPTWTDTEVTVSPDRAWLQLVLTFTLQRFERVRS